MSKISANEERQAERREEKAQGRDRRAELLLDTEAKEKARHNLLEGRQALVEAELAQLKTELANLKVRVATLEQIVAPTPAP